MAGRKVLYFLGAGASRGAGAVAQVQAGGDVKIPVQNDFWPTVLRFVSRADRAEIEAFLFRYFAGYKKPPARKVGLIRTRLLAGIDVEEVFTFLSERARAPSTLPQLRAYVERIWRLLVVAIGTAFRRFRANTRTRGIYRAMCANHVRSRDALVSFNYDTVFEESLPGAYPWHYEGLAGHAGGLRVLKPHGSVNWAIKNGGIRVSAAADVPVLVAPTHLKFVRGDAPSPSGSVPVRPPPGYLDVSPEIQGIWAGMELQMQQAKALVFIGYSFPQADLYFSSVLRSVLARRMAPPAVVLVNPDALAIAARVKERFKVAEPKPYFDIDQFVHSSRGAMLGGVEG